MNQLLTDIRSGIRMLVKYPTLSLVATLTLGLGIGLSTTVFCVVNGGLFKGLPFPDADRVVALVSTNRSQKQPQQPVKGTVTYFYCSKREGWCRKGTSEVAFTVAVP